MRVAENNKQRSTQSRLSKASRIIAEAIEARVLMSVVSYPTAGTAITQNFGGMSVGTNTAATATTATGQPWELNAAFPNGFGTTDSLGGWFTSDLGTSAPASKLALGKPSTTTGALFDFNNGNPGSQALGTISTGSVNSRFGVILQNTTGQTLTQFTLTYTGEQWWEGTGGGTQELDLSYGTFATLPTFPTATSPAGYSADANLKFVAPQNHAGTATYLDGTLAANQQTGITDTVGLSGGWANNAYLVLYWQTASTGSGDGMGVANFNLSAVGGPAITSSTANLVSTATSMTINGSNFDPTVPVANHNTVTFDNGVTGSVTAATSTSLTVSLTGLSSVPFGTVLNASVTVDGTSSGAEVPVATVEGSPMVTSSADSIGSNATSITIAGNYFDPTAANNVVTFSNGVTGTVTAATLTSVTVTSVTGLSTVAPGTALKASVTVDGASSGTAVQVGTVVTPPTVTGSTTPTLLTNATSITINGTGFDPNSDNDAVTFDNGVAGTIADATTTSVTVAFTAGMSVDVLAAGTVLNASVVVNGVASTAAQVATIEPYTIPYSTPGSGGAYVPDFNSLPLSSMVPTPSTAAGSPVQGPYNLASSSTGAFGADGSLDSNPPGLNGWYSDNVVGTAEKFAVGEPGATTGAMYDFNDGTSGSQSLGTISTTAVSSRFGAIFTNTSGQTLTQFTLSYTGEEWWLNSGAGVTLNFSYELGAASLPTAVSAGTTVSALSYTGTTGAANYNDAYTNDTYNANVSGTVSNIEWLPGQTLAIFWDKGGGAGTSAGLGIANVSFSASAAPAVTASTANILSSASIITINGNDFDPNDATVAFTPGTVTGTINTSLSTSTSLVVNVTGLGGAAGPLLALVSQDGSSSGSPVQVATVVGQPTVTASTGNLAANATRVTILGTNFDLTPGNNTVTFSNGVTGTISGATATSLTVTSLSGLSGVAPGTALKATVTESDGGSSGTAVQIATVVAASTPTVTPSTTNVADDATSITIAGTGFDSAASGDTVQFDNGVTGAVSSATATSLTVTSLTGLDVLAAGTVLNAAVTVDGVSSGSPVQVATIIAGTVGYSTAGGVYTQNFSTLPLNGNPVASTDVVHGTGTPAIGPYNLASSSTGAFGASGLDGWYSANLLNNPDLFADGKPSTTTGALFDFNDGTAGSQSLGTISTGTTASRFGVIFTNNTGQTLTQFSLSYIGEEWWDNLGAGTALNFSYKLGVSALPTGANSGTSVDGLGFTAPDSSGNASQAGYYIDAYTDAAYTSGASGFSAQVPVGGTVTGISWAPGTTLAIFWDKGTGAPTSDGLGIADVNFTASVTPTVTPSTANLPATSTSLVINGGGFDILTLANNTVVFSDLNGDTITGTVTAATSTSLTVTDLTGLTAVAPGTELDATVTIDGSDLPIVAVATVVPGVTLNTSTVAINATTLTINGAGFDPNSANDSVTFSNGVTGTIHSATANSLSISNLSGLVPGSTLTAVVTATESGMQFSSGTPVQVAAVAQQSTSTAVTSNDNPSDYGTSVTFTATVTGAFGTITGEVVTFYDGANSIGTGMLNASGMATLPISTLSSGSHSITATYAGDTANASSTSTALPQVVNNAVVNPVTVTSVVINGNNSVLAGSQRSMVDSIVYTFSEAVNIAMTGTDSNPGIAIAIHGAEQGTLPTLSWSSPDGGVTWIVTFTGSSVIGNSIANGVYDITLNPTAITSVAHPSASFTARGTDTFYRLYGDYNGDHTVNAVDNAHFKTALTTNSAIFDYNADGNVNAVDNAHFKASLSFTFNESFTTTI